MTTRYIRYTRGPDELWLGDTFLKKGTAVPMDADLAAQALLDDRVKEYGFEDAQAPSVHDGADTDTQGE